MKAVVHIGTEKTGSSTIQECLYINRQLLKKHGVGVLETPGKRNNSNLAAYAMSDDYFDSLRSLLSIRTPDELNDWRIRFKNEFKREINTLDDGIDTCIISSEHFHSRLPKLSEINRLAELLNSLFDEIKILVYLRRQDQVAVSFYSTKCIVGYDFKNILPVGKNESDHYYNYYDLLEKWSSVFGRQNLIIRVFDKDKFHHGNLLVDFFKSAGIYADNIDLQVPGNQNESISATTQLVLRNYNKHFPSHFESNSNNTVIRIRNLLNRRINEMFPGGGLLPSRKDAIAFYKAFAESNRKLAEKWFGKDNIFSEDFSYYPETSSPDLIDSRVLDVVYEIIRSELGNYIYHKDDEQP